MASRNIKMKLTQDECEYIVNALRVVAADDTVSANEALDMDRLADKIHDHVWEREAELRVWD